MKLSRSESNNNLFYNRAK
uniref:Uncharacterized protein n=1 Tax=Rhizophora mucronata TaxID=61149 RepID=A0A2P2Q9Z0_RHIMU